MMESMQGPERGLDALRPQPKNDDGSEHPSRHQNDSTKKHGRELAHRSDSPVRNLVRRPEFGSLTGIVVVFIFFAIVSSGSGFLSGKGTASWLNVSAELGVIAVPVALLMIAGELDLSIGAMVGTTTIAVALGSGYYGLPLWLMIGCAIIIGILVGLLNGLITLRTELPSFIVTLGMWFVLSGSTLGLSRTLAGTSTISIEESHGSAHAVFATQLGQFNISILWWLTITAIAGVVLFKTPFGNWILATGGDAGAARSAGVPTVRVKIMLFICSSIGATLVGIIQAMEYNTGNAASGQAFIFNAIIAVIIGGVLLTGGYGSPIGVSFGAIIYGIVSVGVFYTGWNTDYAQALLGLLLLIAVLANSYFRKMALRVR